jgi:hypothetical protein
MHVEVVAGRRLDAVGLVPVVDEVEVPREDLVLRQRLLERDGILHLLQLAGVALGGCRLGSLAIPLPQGVLLERDLDELLGQGGRALGDLPALEVGDQRPSDAARVHAAVLVEPRVLDRDLGLAHPRRDLVQLDDDAVLVVGGGDQAALGVDDAGLLREGTLLELTGQGVEQVDAGLRGSARCAHSRDEDARGQQAHHHGRGDQGG